jgi:hypothetical protein
MTYLPPGTRHTMNLFSLSIAATAALTGMNVGLTITITIGWLLGL